MGSRRADGSRSLLMRLVWLKQFLKGHRVVFKLQGTEDYENSSLIICGII